MATVATAPRVTLQPVRLRPRWLVVGVVAVLVATTLGLTIGPVSIDPRGALLELVDRLPFIDIDTGLTTRESQIIWNLRLPRVVLGLQVGGLLAIAGASYQGVF